MITAPTIEPNDDVLTIRGAAGLIGITYYAARAAALKGDLPAREVANGLLLVRRADAEAYRQRVRRKVSASRADLPAPAAA